jgi:molybdopterin-guanine dinucleotide biosynthesis protein A
MIKKEEITGVILAGGHSRRMGVSKAFLNLRGKTFIEHIIKAVSSLVHKTIIIANENEYQQFGLEVFKDVVKESGPVGGIHAAMSYSETPYVLVLSCDIPLVSLDLLSFLIEKSIPADLNVISVNDKKQPLTAIYHKDSMPIFVDALEKQALKLRLLFEQMNVNEIVCPTRLISSLANINTPEDLKKINENKS